MAALLADDTIAEMPCPAEKGGYSFEMKNSFYKVFGNAHGHVLQFNFSQDFRNDSVGLGRIMLKNAPYAVLPVLPFTATPSYVVDGKRENASITAVWQDEQYNIVNGADGADRWEYIPGKDGDFKAIQYWKGCRIVWDCRFETSGIAVDISLDGKFNNARVTLPLLKFNGETQYNASLDGNVLKIAGITVENRSGSGFTATDKELANRNGIYRIYQVPLKDKVRLFFSVR